MPNKIYFSLASFISVGILVFACVKLATPMDWDELDAGAKLATHEYDQTVTPADVEKLGIRLPNVIDPRINVRNHSVSSIASLISIRLFGVSKVNLRLPAIPFTALLLLILILAHSFVPRENILFVLAHLAVNGLALWYFHSMRGYAAMMLFTTALYLLALKWTERAALSRAERAALYGLFAVTPLVHAFAGIFCGVLLTSLVIHTFLNAPDRATLRARLIFLGPGAIVLPVVAYLFLYQLKFISRVGYLMSPASKVSAPALSLFGVTGGAAMATVVVAALLGVALAIGRKQFRSLPFIFVALAWSGLTVVLGVLKPSFFEPRFILCFLIPTLFWFASLDFGGMTSAFGRRRLKWAVLGAVFIALPLTALRGYPSPVLDWLESYDGFLREVTARVDPAKNCFRFSGEFDQAYFSRSIFFRNTEACAGLYQLHFGNAWQGKLPVQTDAQYRYEKIFADQENRSLFRLSPRPAEGSELSNNK